MEDERDKPFVWVLNKNFMATVSNDDDQDWGVSLHGPVSASLHSFLCTISPCF